MMRLKINKTLFPVVQGDCFVREFTDQSEKPLFFSKKDNTAGAKRLPVERGHLTQVEFTRFMSLKGVKLERKKLDNGKKVVDYTY